MIFDLGLRGGGCAAHAYVGITRVTDEDGIYPAGEIRYTMKFAVKDVDPSTGQADEEGNDDVYALDALTLRKGHLWVEQTSHRHLSNLRGKL